jgi:hypothetical protein
VVDALAETLPPRAGKRLVARPRRAAALQRSCARSSASGCEHAHPGRRAVGMADDAEQQDRPRRPGRRLRRARRRAGHRRAQRTDARLIEIWQDALGVRPIGIADDFFGSAGSR